MDRTKSLCHYFSAACEFGLYKLKHRHKAVERVRGCECFGSQRELMLHRIKISSNRFVRNVHEVRAY